MAIDKEQKRMDAQPKFELGDEVWAKNNKTLAGRTGRVIGINWEMPQSYQVQFGPDLWKMLEKDLELVSDEHKQPVQQMGPATGEMKEIPIETYNALKRLGMLDTSVRSYNRGTSDYSQHFIQPWSIWLDYKLDPFDADIVKRILRTKQGDSRRLDYEKIIHICEEKIRQIECE